MTNKMKLPKFIFDRVKEHKTSLGNNEAFPPEEDYPFDYKILKKRFNDVCEGLSYLDNPTTDEDYLKSYLSRLLTRVKEIELPIRPYLIKLCENLVNKQLSIPDETIILNCELVDEISPKNAFRLMPEESDVRDFDFEDLNDFDNVSKVIMKRRLINSLIQGVAYNCNKLWEDYIDEELMKLNEELPKLYNEISVINDYLLFIKEENITDEKPNQGACVEVMLGGNGEKTEINVQGLIFPYLLQETFRGFFELFASHGLPEDNNKANYIIRQADFLLAEPWDMRMGVELWNILSEDIKDTRILPYFFTTLCEMQVEEFNEYLKEAFAKTKKGKSFIKELIKESEHFVEMNSFIDTVRQRNADVAVLNDSYISSDEMDDYVLQEDGEENNNENIDYLSLITNCGVNDIDFNPEQINDYQFQMHLLINGIQIPIEIVNFKAEPRNINGNDLYQMHLFISDEYQHKGLGYKLYKRFIELYGNVYSGNGRRMNNNEIISIFKRLNTEPNIKVVKVNNNGIFIGLKAFLI